MQSWRSRADTRGNGWGWRTWPVQLLREDRAWRKQNRDVNPGPQTMFFLSLLMFWFIFSLQDDSSRLDMSPQPLKSIKTIKINFLPISFCPNRCDLSLITECPPDERNLGEIKYGLQFKMAIKLCLEGDSCVLFIWRLIETIIVWNSYSMGCIDQDTKISVVWLFFVWLLHSADTVFPRWLGNYGEVFRSRA